MSTIVTKYTYAGLVQEAMTRKKHPNCNEESSRTGDFGFTQTLSMEEAEKFAIEGWDLGLKEYKIEDGLVVSGSTNLYPSLAGYIPHVQNHIMGLPEEMYSLYDDREYNLPTLDLVVHLTYSCFVEGPDALKFSKSLVSYINAKASTRNIRLTGIFASTQKNNKKVYDIITLKDFDSALVINNIAFAFHPSFFRRLWFSTLESKEYWGSGYGRVIDDYKDIVKKELTGGKSDETLFFKALSSIEKYDWLPEDLESITF